MSIRESKAPNEKNTAEGIMLNKDRIPYPIISYVLLLVDPFLIINIRITFQIRIRVFPMKTNIISKSLYCNLL